MEESEAREESLNEPSSATAKPFVRPVSDGPASGSHPVHPAQEPCPTCGTGGASTPPSFVYALGRIEPRFPRLSVEKEFAQATGRAETVHLTDRQALRKVLEENRYLVRQLCWVMTVGGMETYILLPRDPADFHLLVEALRPSPHPGDIDLVVGIRGPLAAQDMCNGLLVPIVAFDQVYSFDRDSLIGAIPKPEKTTEAKFKEAAGEVFESEGAAWARPVKG